MLLKFFSHFQEAALLLLGLSLGLVLMSLEPRNQKMLTVRHPAFPPHWLTTYRINPHTNQT